jgi:hypothetical protein
MTTWDEAEAQRCLAEAQAKQAVHRRLLQARDAGVDPDPADVAAAADWERVAIPRFRPRECV